ncbi:hypothetical protein ABTU74_21965 [Acinetobacter baumannii]
MKNNIFFKLIAIIFYVFGTYWFLLFLYDLYFYKHFYNKFCSFFYCLEYIEFKDYASIIATLIGSAFVAYSLFSWKDTFKFNLVKNDIERFRFATHNLMKNLNSQFGSFADQVDSIEIAKGKGIEVADFNITLVHYEDCITQLNALRVSTIELYNEFTFEIKYFILHGGKIDADDFTTKLKDFLNSLDELHSAFNDNNITEYLNAYPKCEEKKRIFTKDAGKLLSEIYKILNK